MQGNRRSVVAGSAPLGAVTHSGLSDLDEISTGDFLADDVGVGFRNGFLLLAGIMVLLAAAHYLTSINGTLLF